MKKIFVISFVVFNLFSVLPAFAGTDPLYTKYNNFVDADITSGLLSSTNTDGRFCVAFTAATSGIPQYIEYHGGGGDFNGLIILDDDSFPNACDVGGTSSNEINSAPYVAKSFAGQSTSSQVAGQTYLYRSFFASASSSLIQGHKYYFIWEHTATGSSYGTSSTAEFQAAHYRNAGSNLWEARVNNNTASFAIKGIANPLLSNSITWIYPQNNFLVGSDFSNWNLSYNIQSQNDISTSTPGQIVIRYGVGSSTQIIDRKYITSPSSSLIQIPKSNFLVYPQYSAWAEIVDYSTTTLFGDSLASTSIIAWSMNTTSSPWASPSFASSTEDCSGYTIGLFSSTTLPGILCVARQGVSWTANLLFIPHEISREFAAGALDQWKNIFPFSLFFSLNEIQQNSIGLGRATSSLTLQMTGNTVITTSTIWIFNSTALEDIIGTSARDQLWNFFVVIWAVALGISFMYIIFKL